MFDALGRFVSTWWIAVLAIWLFALVGLRAVAPPFNDIATGGEFIFLPEHMPSRRAEELLNRAFPDRRTSSSMVVIVHREEKGGLTDDDRSFIDETLKPALELIRDQVNPSTETPGAGSSSGSGKDNRIITEIHTFSDPGIGSLLISDDQMSSLVTMDMALDFQDTRNWGPVQKVADALSSLERSDQKPKGLQFALTGSATLGRDMTSAEAASARNTGPMTITLAIALLVVIYRAPLIALVPLFTLFVSVDIALHFLTVLAQLGYVPLFKGLQEYTTVITYGPGIDYCLFLIARYKENLEECVPPKESLSRAIGQVGSAIVASAGNGDLRHRHDEFCAVWQISPGGDRHQHRACDHSCRNPDIDAVAVVHGRPLGLLAQAGRPLQRGRREGGQSRRASCAAEHVSAVMDTRQ